MVNLPSLPPISRACFWAINAFYFFTIAIAIYSTYKRDGPVKSPGLLGIKAAFQRFSKMSNLFRLDAGDSSRNVRVLVENSAQAIDSSGGNGTGKLIADTNSLFNAWMIMYDLNNGNPMTSSVNRTIEGNVFPLAPHLQDCHRLTEHRKKMDVRGTNNSLPEWAIPSVGEIEPRTPWIEGADDDNLPMTREIQAHIWKNQFPEDCNSDSVKFALLQWRPLAGHGLGSQLHVLSHQFKLALSEGRTAVMAPGLFDRADESVCKGENKGTLNCFFFPMVAPECEKRAISLWKGAGDDRVKRIVTQAALTDTNIEPFDSLKPWLQSQQTTEILGTIANVSDVQSKVNFWHAQILRFVLRWPSAFLCHELNKIRQEAFGQETAGLIAKMHRDRLVTREAVLANKGHEAEALRRAESLGPTAHTLENDVWWELPPFVPRPIVSVYVRQGDKGREMKLFSLPSYMFLAERLKTHTPNVRFVWLSTEMQSVVEAVKYFPDWKFYFTGNKRQRGQKSMFEYTIEYGPTQLTLLSFANLIISAECDFFVAPLASNWGRLINELRQTGGKLKAGFLAVNYDEW